jgi:DtxR family Mn-dependent transcriptional regulator
MNCVVITDISCHETMKNSSEPFELSASLEDYIEAIYHIVEEKLVARSKDIAARLGVSRASVTEALRALARKELINYAPYEAITMTEQGKKVAEDVIHRHESLRRFFMEVLAIDSATAEEAACKVEHAAPPVVISRMIDFIAFLRVCPRGGDELLNGFAQFTKHGRLTGDCDNCITDIAEKETDSSRPGPGARAE